MEDAGRGAGPEVEAGRWTGRQCCLEERKDNVWELGAEVTRSRERRLQRSLGNKIIRTWRLIRWDC